MATGLSSVPATMPQHVDPAHREVIQLRFMTMQTLPNANRVHQAIGKAHMGLCHAALALQVGDVVEFATPLSFGSVICFFCQQAEPSSCLKLSQVSLPMTLVRHCAMIVHRASTSPRPPLVPARYATFCKQQASAVPPRTLVVEPATFHCLK